MNVTVDLRSRTPIYEQIINNIKERALSGELKADQQLPSIRQLTHQLGINPNTIHKAYAELERQGVIYSLAGRGAFIAADDEVKKLANEKCEELMQNIETSISAVKKFGAKKDDVQERIERVIDKVYKQDKESEEVDLL